MSMLRRRRLSRGAVNRAHPAATAAPRRAHPAEHDLGVERGLP